MVARHFGKLAVLVSALLAGCPSPAEGPDTAERPAPFEVGGQVGLVQPGQQSLLLVRNAGGKAALRRLPAKVAGLPMYADADHQRQLWLDAASRKVMTTTGSKLDQLTLPAAFTGLRLASDGNMAVAFHAAGVAAVDGLVNTDDVALLDLAGGTVRAATVADLAQAPQSAVVSGSIAAADGEHRLVLLLGASKLGIADFGPASVRTQVVPLSADPQVVVTPQQVEVVAGIAGVSLFVRASGLADVLHLQLDLNQTALQVALDQVAAGQQPIQLQVVSVTEGQRVLTVGASRQQLAWLDPQTGTGQQLALTAGVSELVAATSPAGTPLAIGWLPGSRAVTVVDLANLTKKKGKAIAVLSLDAGVQSVQVEAGKLIARHAVAAPALTVVDLATQKRSTFATKAPASAMRLVGSQLWLLMPSGGDALLAKVALDDLRGEVLALGEPASALLRLGDNGVAVAGSGGSGGWWLAGFPSGDLQGSDRWVLDGYAWQGLLDAEVQ